MPKVGYNKANMMQCNCATCPVQENSSCIKVESEEIVPQNNDSDEITDEELVMQAPGSLMPDPKLVPGLYCAQVVNGSSCGDLEFEKACICPSCAVWAENDLKSYHYCKNGSAEKNG